MSDANDQQQQQQQRKRRGCLFYGCGALVVVFLAVLLMGYLGYRAMTGFVRQYTDSEPEPLPPLQITEEQKEQMQARIETFADALRDGKPTVPLVFRGDDLNVLLASKDDLKKFADHLRLNVVSNQVKGQVSMKLGDLGAPFFKDRYLNGTATFHVSMENGALFVAPSEITVNGKPLPEKYLLAMRSQNLAQGVDQDPKVKPTLQKLESIDVEDGALKVVPKTTD